MLNMVGKWRIADRVSAMAEDSINARHFEIFMAVMLSPTLDEAARRLSITQPAISKALRVLETETGGDFFRRVKGRLQPTPEATRLLPYVQRALTHLKTAKRMAYGARGHTSGHVSIATSVPALLSLLPVAVTALIRERPGTTAEILPDTTTRGVLERVVERQVDIGITNVPSHNVDNRIVQLCASRPISEDAIVAILPTEHRLARQPVIRPTDLRGEPIVTLPDDTPNMLLVSAAFQQAKVEMKASILCGNSMGVCAFVAKGAGVGLINSLQLIDNPFPNIVVRPFRPKILLRTHAYYSMFEPLSEVADRLLAIMQSIRAN
jgi:DNA-binding transcriptional LysR family regulator